MNNDKIACVIVTYNRLEFLRESLDAVLHQTRPLDRIYPVNNNSSDGTAEYLDSVKNDLIAPIHLKTNSGGAGGFHHGIRKAFEEGADWIWIMDDDTVANNDALENLITSRMFDPRPMFEETGFLASRVDWTDGQRCRMNIPQPAWEWNWFHDNIPGCYRLYGASFVSILINRKAIAGLGYPVKEFFIWFDDWEYTHRISAQFPCFYVAQSIVQHKIPENVGVNYTDVVDDNIWKFEYGIRNEVAINSVSKLGFIDATLLLVRKLNMMRKAKKPKRLIWRILKAGIRGFFFRYKKYIEMPDNKNSS